jgi:gliding motility-associated-like protein
MDRTGFSFYFSPDKKLIYMKLFFTLTCSLMTCLALAQAPANDDCLGIIDLGEIPYCSQPAQYTNVGATASNIDAVNNIPACFNGVQRDVWFQFTLPADGSIVDINISVFGNIDGNGTMQMPQVAIYRGDCEFGGLAELACASAPLNVNQVNLEQFGLTPGIVYYLRINDYSATAGSNAGTFKLCIEKYVPEFNMGDVTQTQSCTGTLYDSGGPAADYGTLEDLTLTICPQEFHQCIVINVENYSIEDGWDYLQFYQGDDISGLQITQITGAGNNFQVQIPAPCATIRFTSDAGTEEEGFKITWTCSPAGCTGPEPTTCSDPDVIPGLPYAQNNLSNCFSGNSIADGPCDDPFLLGNDYIFSYTSPGDECIKITTNGTNFGAGIGVYDNCPTLANAACVASAGGGFASQNPSLQAAFLENPGTYYIVFGAGEDCSPFSIEIDTVTCPVVLPPAATCDQALNIGGCSNLVPETIALNPGAGDPDFIQIGVNSGCFVNPQQNYSFFYFQAGADGKFGFIVEAADPNEASDIDINVWGPIPSVDQICEYVTNNQPIRSTWTGGDQSTGLTDINPIDGSAVTDEFDCGDPNTPGAGGDRYVSQIDVQEGEIYVILLDDFGNSIVNGGISIDFTGTTAGVLDAPGADITVTADTAVCPGETVQLLATGGEAYFWTPPAGLSCSNCANPVATITGDVSYQVQIATTCNTISRTVDIKLIDIDLGPDVTVCNNAAFTLNPNPYPFATYNWIGGPGLSCYDCPSPEVSGLTTGVYIYIAILTTPQCVKTDTIKINVVNGEQPQYNLADDQVICAGETVSLGGAAIAGSFYDWSSIPGGFNSSEANPSATPNQTTTYFINVTNGSCPVSSIDSVTITVFQSPILQVQGDTAICNGASVLLGATIPQAGTDYVWTPQDNSLSNDSIANPIAMPQVTTQYTLTASNPGCVEVRTVTVAITNLDVDWNLPDTVFLCLGTPLPINVTVNPPTTPVSWTPTTFLTLSPNGQQVVSNPIDTVTYTATISLPGCKRQLRSFVQVDSLPYNLAIFPSDTTVCLGSKVILVSKTYEPADFPDIEFEWTPAFGLLSPDSLFNLVTQPNDTVVYQRIARHRGCVDTSFATVNVVVPPQMQIIPSDTTICTGNSVQLTLIVPPGVEDIEWTPATSLSCDDCNNPIATPIETTSYTARGKFDGCPTETSAQIKVVNPPVLQFPSDTKLCVGESVTLNSLTIQGTTYTWTSTDPGFGTVTTPQPTITPTQTATYFVTADNGCPTQAQVTITVDAASVQALGDTTICAGNSANISAQSTIPGNFNWSNGQTGQSIVVSPAQTTNYTVTFNFGDGCSISDQVLVTVQGQSADIQFPSDVEICIGESILLNNANTPGATYQWSSSPAGFSSSNPQPEVTPTQTTTYTLTTTLGTCVKTASVTVAVFNATLTMPDDAEICPGDDVGLVANATATGTYQWSNGDADATLNLNDLTQSGLYTVVFTYGSANAVCTLSGEVEVIVKPGIQATLTCDPAKDTLDLGTSVEITPVVTPTQNLNGFQFAWTQNGASVGGNTQVINVQPEATPTQDSFARFIYSVTVTSTNGCTAVVAKTLTFVLPDVQIPNAFTPNGDSVNDVFRIVTTRGIAVTDQMEIYNRWGKKVFESTDPNAAWDGKIDGKDAPMDVYVYAIRWRNGLGALVVLHGDVTLIR